MEAAFAWFVAASIGGVILFGPPTLVVLFINRKTRDAMLARTRAKRAARRERAAIMAQASRDAKEAILQAELDQLDAL